MPSNRRQLTPEEVAQVLARDLDIDRGPDSSPTVRTCGFAHVNSELRRLTMVHRVGLDDMLRAVERASLRNLDLMHDHASANVSMRRLEEMQRVAIENEHRDALFWEMVDVGISRERAARIADDYSLGESRRRAGEAMDSHDATGGKSKGDAAERRLSELLAQGKPWRSVCGIVAEELGMTARHVRNARARLEKKSGKIRYSAH